MRSHSGHTLRPIGKLKTTVPVNGQEAKLDLFVVPQSGPALFGRDWLKKLRLNWIDIKELHLEGIPMTDHTTNLNYLLKQHKVLFADGIRKLKDIKAHLTLKDNADPKFLKAHSVPYAIRLQQEGIKQHVAHSD